MQVPKYCYYCIRTVYSKNIFLIVKNNQRPRAEIIFHKKVFEHSIGYRSQFQKICGVSMSDANH